MSGSLNFILAVLVPYQVWTNINQIRIGYSFGLSISLTAALAELGWDSGRSCLHSPANPLLKLDGTKEYVLSRLVFLVFYLPFLELHFLSSTFMMDIIVISTLSELC